MFSDMIPMVISILDRELPLLALTQISSLECTHNSNRLVIHLHHTPLANVSNLNLIMLFLELIFHILVYSLCLYFILYHFCLFIV